MTVTITLFGAISACSSASHGSTNASASEGQNQQNYLLQLQDLPAGYVTAVGASSTAAIDVRPSECQALVDPAGGLLESAAYRREARFAYSTDGPFVYEQVGRYTSGAVADHVVGRFRSAVATCPTWTQNGAQFATHVMSFPAVTAVSLATRASGPGIVAYLVVAAQGKWIVVISVAGASEPSLADTEAIARAAVRRVPTS